MKPSFSFLMILFLLTGNAYLETADLKKHGTLKIDNCLSSNYDSVALDVSDFSINDNI